MKIDLKSKSFWSHVLAVASGVLAGSMNLPQAVHDIVKLVLGQ